MTGRRTGIGGHEDPNRGRSEDWITPKYFIDDLGPFDLDPCRSLEQPWECAEAHYTINNDGLMLPWHGFVWMNPPYGPYVERWLNKLALHNDGIALIFARTETKMFFRYVWGTASALVFIKGRVKFYKPSGELGPWTSGGPSVLIGYGEEAKQRLKRTKIGGYFVDA